MNWPGADSQQKTCDSQITLEICMGKHRLGEMLQDSQVPVPRENWDFPDEFVNFIQINNFNLLQMKKQKICPHQNMLLSISTMLCQNY